MEKIMTRASYKQTAVVGFVAVDLPGFKNLEGLDLSANNPLSES
jgi:hypothetical protein